jgi:hypothetical protein
MMVSFSKHCTAKTMSRCDAFIHIRRLADMAELGDNRSGSAVESGLCNEPATRLPYQWQIILVTAQYWWPHKVSGDIAATSVFSSMTRPDRLETKSQTISRTVSFFLNLPRGLSGWKRRTVSMRAGTGSSINTWEYLGQNNNTRWESHSIKQL